MPSFFAGANDYEEGGWGVSAAFYMYARCDVSHSTCGTMDTMTNTLPRNVAMLIGQVEALTNLVVEMKRGQGGSE